MQTTHRRYLVFFLLYVFSGIAYLDRVNMSVAGKSMRAALTDLARRPPTRPE
jgi:hypothetical protein